MAFPWKLRAVLRLGRAKRQIGKYTGEVRLQLSSDELRVNLRIEILHIEKVYDVSGLLQRACWVGGKGNGVPLLLLNVEGCSDGLLRCLL